MQTRLPHLLRAAVAVAGLVAALGLTVTAGTGAAAAPRIVGGQVTPEGAWPAQVSLQAQAQGQGPWRHFCGGTLVAPRWVLTAAHCATGLVPTDLRAVVGIRRLADVRPADRLVVDRIVVHPKAAFHEISVTDDVALVRLAQPHAGPYARLIGPGQDGSWGVGSLATVTGWGLTKENGRPSPVLRQADVPIVADAACKAAYPDLDPRSNVCAGWPDGGRDACQGDSGGPLWMPVGRTWYQVGIVSSGDGCARPGRPGTYAEVRALRSFILATLKAG